MKKTIILLAVLVFAASWLALANLGGLQSQPSSKNKVQDKIPSKAYPFELSDVRLLDGPFREAMLRDQKYLLELDSDRLLHNFRVTAGLPSTAQPLGGWEEPKGELRGHSVGHFLTACGLMYAATGDARFKDKGNGIVAELAKVQEAMPSRGFNKGFLSAYPEEFFDRVDKRIRVWAPYYTLHKIMAGLLDMYLYCDNRQALDVVTKMADWVKFRVDRLTDEQQQAALETEHGGMNEVLANLYGVTGNPDYLTTAFKFNHKKLFDQWAAGEDKLDGLHGNTQFPKVIGAFREYQLTGEKRYLDIAGFFWDRVALHRSFVTGGNTNGESFFPIDQFSKNLSPSTTETCNTYNMLKLTRQLFGLEPSAEKMDFYERGLFNHILASQDPASGMMCYYVPLRPGAFKTYSTPNDSFWCCVGTGMENHAKYGDTIFFHDDRSLYVNLFIASELNWKDKGLVVRQETKFPDEDAAKLTFQTKKPLRLALKIRYPSWVSSGMTMTINGKSEPVNAKPGSYASIEREWKNGDTVQIRWPMSLRLEAMPDDPKMIAIMYGPIVLAGDLGREGLTEAMRYGPNAPQLNRLPSITIPVFIGEVKDVLGRVKPAPAPAAPLNFQTVGLGQPQDVRLIPFYKAFDQRYTVYWKVLSSAEWDERKAEIAAKESRRKEIEGRTLDAVNINDEQSETGHGFKGENASQGYFEGKRTREARNGWFSYELKVLPDKPMVLACTYVGSFGRPRTFDILVDGEKVATQTLEAAPAGLFDVEYKLPEPLTRGKQRVTVKFQSLPKAGTGSLVDIRIIQ
jgi:DUF1680 family protein